jgi:septal ring factor EnvC (AmiA/AmiB activator)
MAQEPLLQMLEQLATRIKSLEREKREVAAKTQALEREVEELRDMIWLAESKVEQMLKGDPPPLSSEQLEELKRRFPLLFTSTDTDTY